MHDFRAGIQPSLSIRDLEVVPPHGRYKRKIYRLRFQTTELAIDGNANEFLRDERRGRLRRREICLDEKTVKHMYELKMDACVLVDKIYIHDRGSSTTCLKLTGNVVSEKLSQGNVVSKSVITSTLKQGEGFRAENHPERLVRYQDDISLTTCSDFVTLSQTRTTPASPSS